MSSFHSNLPLGIASGCIGTTNLSRSRSIAESYGFCYAQAHFKDFILSPLSGLDHPKVSIHSTYFSDPIKELAQITALNALQKPVVVHPREDLTLDWNKLGPNLILENLDGRSTYGNTVATLKHAFKRFPKARWCFDIGHAFHVDPSGLLPQKLIDTFGDKLQQIHLSHLASDATHIPITPHVIQTYVPYFRQLPSNTLITLELSVNQPPAVIKDQYILIANALLKMYEGYVV
jgi:hypothetical protein